MSWQETPQHVQSHKRWTSHPAFLCKTIISSRRNGARAPQSNLVAENFMVSDCIGSACSSQTNSWLWQNHGHRCLRLLGHIRTECRLWTPVPGSLLYHSSSVSCSIFSILRGLRHWNVSLDNFIWSELCGEKRRGNPSLAWKHWQNEPKPATKTQAEGLPWLKGRRGKQEVVEFHVPFDACNPRLSKLKARFKLKHFRPPWLVKTKSSNRNSNYKTQPAHMCSLHKSTERERGRARVRLGLCMGFVHFHDAKIEVESFLQANSGYTKRVTRLTSH